MRGKPKNTELTPEELITFYRSLNDKQKDIFDTMMKSYEASKSGLCHLYHLRNKNKYLKNMAAKIRAAK